MLAPRNNTPGDGQGDPERGETERRARPLVAAWAIPLLPIGVVFDRGAAGEGESTAHNESPNEEYADLPKPGGRGHEFLPMARAGH